MDWNHIAILISTIILQTESVRLHELFQFLDGFKSDHNLQGYLHIGSEYSIFLKVPKPHDRFLTYELYESKNLPEPSKSSPRLIAVSKIPVEYLKEQLRIYREELYTAKYKDQNTVPGTQVRTVREWQIEKALDFSKNGRTFNNKAPVLRTAL